MATANTSTDVTAIGPTLITEEEARIYDRQIRLWGLDIQQRLSSSHILIIGLTAVHLEAAKNLLLAGLRLTLCCGHVSLTQSRHTIPPPNLHPSHLLFNFFAAASHVTVFNSREEVLAATVEQLKHLNPLVKVNSQSANDLIDCLDLPLQSPQHPLKLFNAILVATECLSLEDIFALNHFCRETGKGFFLSRSIGPHGGLFQDFGKAYHAEGRCGGEVVRARRIEYCALKDLLSIPIQQLPTGKKYSAKKHPHLKLLLLNALMRYEQQKEAQQDFVEYGMELFQQADVPMRTEDERRGIRDRLDEWKRLDGLAFPTSSAVLGGLLAQEIQRFISCLYAASKDSSTAYEQGIFNNLLILDANDSEGLVFSLGIRTVII